MATATKAVKGFQVRCPYCATEDATLSIDLNALECHCGDCDADFTPAEAVRQASEQLRRWQAVARWAGMAGAAPADLPGEEEAD